jgi:uncharacterized Tic20 family protein
MDQNPFTEPVPTTSAQDGNCAPANKDDNTLGLVCHLLALTGLLVPFGSILGPLILWLVKRGDSPYLDSVGKEVVNFNISWAVYMVVAAFSILALVGFLLLPLVALAWLILVVLGAINASNGKFHRYPLTIRLIK